MNFSVTGTAGNGVAVGEAVGVAVATGVAVGVGAGTGAATGGVGSAPSVRVARCAFIDPLSAPGTLNESTIIEPVILVLSERMDAQGAKKFP
ncbi:hypothetical protein D3C81_1807720 [compost metagenome]